MYFTFLASKDGFMKALDLIESKFEFNATAKKVVSRKFIVREVELETYLTRVEFETIFPSFKIPAMYVAAISIIISILFWNVYLIIPGMFGCLFLLLPDFIIRPRLLFLVLSKSLRKHKYKGKLMYLGGQK